MTNTQFEAVAKLISLRKGPASMGARLVLVDGLKVTQAAKQAGCSRQSVGNTVARVKKALGLAVLAIHGKTYE